MVPEVALAQHHAGKNAPRAADTPTALQRQRQPPPRTRRPARRFFVAAAPPSPAGHATDGARQGPLLRTTPARPTLRAACSRSSATRRAPDRQQGQQGARWPDPRPARRWRGQWRVSSPWSANCRLTSAVEDMAAAALEQRSALSWLPQPHQHQGHEVRPQRPSANCQPPVRSCGGKSAEGEPSPTMNSSSATPARTENQALLPARSRR